MQFHLFDYVYPTIDGIFIFIFGYLWHNASEIIIISQVFFNGLTLTFHSPGHSQYSRHLSYSYYAVKWNMFMSFSHKGKIQIFLIIIKWKKYYYHKQVYLLSKMHKNLLRLTYFFIKSFYIHKNISDLCIR